MFEYREQCRSFSDRYLLLQGDRILAIGVFCVLSAVVSTVAWIIPFGSWISWLHYAVFFYLFCVYWVADERNETVYGRAGDSVSDPPTVRGRLILGVVLTALLVASGLVGSPLGAAELVVAAWMVGHLLLGGQLRRLYIVVGISLGLVGGYHMLGALFGELEASSNPWFISLAGAVIVLRALSDQGTFGDALKSARETGDYDV